ncbi:MAG: hypothetical protein LBQ12_04355 [Deltaproteobacteria bacterium]|nr:hypothetical protein [Deltaproteobacteria bacterium]
MVFFDDADWIPEEPLVMFLDQISSGYLGRSDSPPIKFPKSMAFVGMRDIRNYLPAVRHGEKPTGLSNTFNITKKSLTLDNFSLEEINSLYSQHTAATGQFFEPNAVERAWYWSDGQPRLVNAIADDILVRQFRKNYSKIVTKLDIDKAVGFLTLRKTTLLDFLWERIKEPRVRRVIGAVISSDGSLPEDIADIDLEYVLDLGLLKADPDNNELYVPSNPIYQELITRFLTRKLEKGISRELKGKWMDGTKLDMNGLLRVFQVYWRENSEVNEMTEADKNERSRRLEDWDNKDLEIFNASKKYNMDEEILRIILQNSSSFDRDDYPHIVLFAFLQRSLNVGVDFIIKEHGPGKTFVDILVGYKDVRHPLELNINGVRPLEESVKRILGHMDECGSPEGWLVVFDRSPGKSWDEKISWETLDRNGKIIHVVGC